MLTLSPLVAIVTVWSVSCSPKASPSSSERTCGMASGAIISDSGLGTLGIGTAVVDIKQRCKVLADTSQPDDEGSPQRILLVQIGDDTLTAVIDDERVHRIEVYSPNVRSPDSLGVGSRLATLLRTGSARALSGEGRYYVRLPAHCGLSFQLPVVEFADSLGYPDVLEGPALKHLSDTLRVTGVFIVGCKSGSGAT